MSQRNGYVIGLSESCSNSEAIFGVLSNAFGGHVDSRGNAIEAEDAPEAGVAFRDGFSEYVRIETVKRILAPFTSDIEYIRHEYSNDTSGRGVETRYEVEGGEFVKVNERPL